MFTIDLFLEQCRLLTTMKDEIRNSRAVVEKAEFEQNKIIGELVEKAIGQRYLSTYSILSTNVMSYHLDR